MLTTCTTFLRCIKNCDTVTRGSLILPKGAASLLRENAEIRVIEPFHVSLTAVIDPIPFDTPMELDEHAYNSRILIDGGSLWPGHFMSSTSGLV